MIQHSDLGNLRLTYRGQMLFFYLGSRSTFSTPIGVERNPSIEHNAKF
jgi:hypothetical protein